MVMGGLLCSHRNGGHSRLCPPRSNVRRYDVNKSPKRVRITESILMSPAASPHHASAHDMHSRLELYATRLAEVEQRQMTVTPDSEDEHHLIAQYCMSLGGDTPTNTAAWVLPGPGQQVLRLKSPMQIMMAIDTEQRTELEEMIKDLEEENKSLQQEYDRLRQARENGDEEVQYSGSDGDMTSRDAEMIAEAKLLRQHKGRLEARMNILEEHNKQLETQLLRLRQLLDQPQAPPSGTSMPSSQRTTPFMTPSSSQTSLHREYPPPRYRFTPQLESTPQVNGHENGGDRLSYDDRRLQDVMRELEDSFPADPPRGTSNVGNLFHMAGQVGKAVGTLVTVMTDEEGSGSDDDIDIRKRAR